MRFRTAWLLAVIAFVVVNPANLVGGVILPNLAPGSQYQLIFVTAGTRDATSSDIADYNAFVNAEAALNPLLPSTTWHAIASTESINASVNTPWTGLPVYNTNGEFLTSASSWSLSGILHPIAFDQYGTFLSTNVWTGTGPYGEEFVVPDGGHGLGRANPVYGRSTALDIFALAAGHNDPNTTPHSLYAKSDPITVPVPEPGSLTLAGTSLVLLAVKICLRRRKRTPFK